ncbi:hypothetical protein ElyMa_002795400 [Elysia marginata]|uniref:Secreted protein n=1 Tax=Elysia marginata TaxID=1093978 RepID=A0AAV4HPB0_9GAST|nr:hypothetical protein ElyMa_002795400 [Elysia marginata]
MARMVLFWSYLFHLTNKARYLGPEAPEVRPSVDSTYHFEVVQALSCPQLRECDKAWASGDAPTPRDTRFSFSCLDLTHIRRSESDGRR